MKIIVACCGLLIASISSALAHERLCMTSYTIGKPGSAHVSRIEIFGWYANGYADLFPEVDILNKNVRAVGEFMDVLKVYGAPTSLGYHRFTKNGAVITVAFDPNAFFDMTTTTGKHLITGDIIDLADGNGLCPIPIVVHPHAQ